MVIASSKSFGQLFEDKLVDIGATALQMHGKNIQPTIQAKAWLQRLGPNRRLGCKKQDKVFVDDFSLIEFGKDDQPGRRIAAHKCRTHRAGKVVGEQLPSKRDVSLTMEEVDGDDLLKRVSERCYHQQHIRDRYAAEVDGKSEVATQIGELIDFLPICCLRPQLRFEAIIVKAIDAQ